jgi:hypothetical protein
MTTTSMFCLSVSVTTMISWGCSASSSGSGDAGTDAREDGAMNSHVDAADAVDDSCHCVNLDGHAIPGR